ncbi:MAG: hypothetical protein JHC73_17755 [Dolichospermum sp.]|jgi:hypothetical protein|nr:hypothetical protein [Dolichospermum sp.]
MKTKDILFISLNPLRSNSLISRVKFLTASGSIGFAEKVVCEEREQGTVSTIWISSISHIRQGKMG